MSMPLTGPQQGQFNDAIRRSFRLEELRRLLRYELDRDLSNFGLGPTYVDVVEGLVSDASSGVWWPQLLANARRIKPDNPLLIELEAALSPTAPMSLEKVVDVRSTFMDVDEFGKRFSQIERALCAVEDEDGNGYGSGFLVGPDLVLTNYHVVQKVIGNPDPKLRCRFDFKVVGDYIQPGLTVDLVAKWLVGHRKYGSADVTVGLNSWLPDQLDFAVLRLAESVGNKPVVEGSSVRHWIDLGRLGTLPHKGDAIYVFQHPQDLTAAGRKLMPAKSSPGRVLDIVGDGMRMRHSARTHPGSSGSLCVDSQLAPVALHHAGDPQDWPDYRGQYNQAIPLSLIARDSEYTHGQV
jgi:hypothetical protein